MSTIILVGVYLFSDGKIPLSPSSKRALYFATLTSSVIATALSPPTSSVLFNYSNAFLSVAYTLRAVELLIINDLSRLKRLEKVHTSHTSSSSVYVWKTMPPELSFHRLRCVCDLLVNPRGIGWAHGSHRYLPRLQRLNDADENEPHSKPGEDEKFILADSTQQYRLTFLAKEALKLLVAYIVFDAYRTYFGRNFIQLCSNFHTLLNTAKLPQYLGFPIRTSPETSERLVRRFLLPPACWAACYAFVDGIRAVIALFAVGGLYVVSPTIAGDPWMYPPVFGPWRYMFVPRLRDIWGKMWHDLCRRPLLSSSSALIPDSLPLLLRRVLVFFFSFVISGLVHAAGTYAVSKDMHAVLMIVVFFILLPICIALQEIVHTQILERVLLGGRTSSMIIWVLDAAFIIWWGYHTAPWFFRYSMVPEALIATPVPDRFSLWAS